MDIQSKLRIFQWNAFGIRSKKEFLLKEFCGTYHVGCFSETLLTNPDGFTLPGYRCLSVGVRDIVQVAGRPQTRGITLAFHESMQCRQVQIPDVFGAEVVAARVGTAQGPVTVVCAYFSPNLAGPNVVWPNKGSWLYDDLSQVLDTLPTPLILCGDLNAHSERWGSTTTTGRGENVEELADHYGLQVLNTGEPTFRSGAAGSLSVLDLALATRDIAPHCQWNVLDDDGGSDHYPTVVVVDQRPHALSLKPPSRWIPEKADWSLYRSVLRDELGTGVRPNGLDDQVRAFTAVIIRAAEAAVPRTVARGAQRPSAPWFNDDCREAKRRKLEAHAVFRRTPSLAALEAFKEASHNCRRVYRTARRDTWRSFCSSVSARTSVGEVWKKFRLMQGRQPGMPLFEGVNTGQDQAELLANRFASVSADANRVTEFVACPHRPVTEGELQESLQSDCEHSTSACSDITVAELDRHLRNLGDKAPGPDSVPNSFLRQLPLEGKLLLAELFSRSFREGVLPSEWKSAIVVPIAKSGKPLGDPASYRPISLTNTMVKLLERIMMSRIQPEIDRFLVANQAGFRKGRGTLGSLLHLERDIADTRARTAGKKFCLAVFLDVEKAFDMAWREGILHKLRSHVPLCYLKWYRDFLHNRKFQVRIGEALSEERVLDNGVPQGSVSSPILYNVLVNDLAGNIPPQVKVSQFADDIALWCTDGNLTYAWLRMQRALSGLEAWANRNGIRINAAKSVAMTFGTRKVARELTLFGTAIPVAPSHRFLGLVLDKDHSWKAHVTAVRGKSSKALGLLRCLRGTDWGCDRQTLTLLYKALIRSRLEYGSAVLVNMSSTQARRLEVVQSQALKICCGLRGSVSHEAVAVEAGVLPLRHRRRVLGASYLAKAQHLDPLLAIDMTEIRDGRDPGRVCRSALAHLTDLLDNCSGGVCEPPQVYPIPGWPGVEIDHQLAAFKHTVPVAARALVAVKISEMRQGTLLIYTDGSHDPATGRTACAWHAPQLGVTDSVRLPDDSDIFSAELLAISMAVQLVRRNLPDSACILTDSMGVATALNTGHSSARGGLVRNVVNSLEDLRSLRVSTLVKWIPSHVGIPGNEVADVAAKDALGLEEIFDLPPTWITLGRKVQRLVHNEWQEEWDRCEKGRGLHRILSDVRSVVCNAGMTSKGERSLARLRSSHVNLNATLFAKGRLVPSRDCEVCQVPEDVDHYLLDCRKYTVQRSQLDQYLRDGVVPLLKLASGASEHGTRARKALCRYVASTVGYSFL